MSIITTKLGVKGEDAKRMYYYALTDELKKYGLYDPETEKVTVEHEQDARRLIVLAMDNVAQGVRNKTYD